jgi:outer membrane protein assembly factor BamB
LLMRPEDVEAVLHRLPCPSPGPGLRERVLRDLGRIPIQERRPRPLPLWGGLALAVSLAVFGGILWIILPFGPRGGSTGRQDGALPFKVVWKSRTANEGIAGLEVMGESLAVSGSPDRRVSAFDRRTGEALWQIAVAGATPLEWPPVTAQGIPEEIRRLEDSLRELGAQIDELLKGKGPGPEVQALQKKRNEVRERLRVASSGDNVYGVSGKELHCMDRRTSVMKWRRALDFVPSARPVAIRGFVFLADRAAGRVRALDVEKQGAEVASYAGPVAGGLVYGDPLVCFGGDDGQVRAYKVTDGTLIWRLGLEGKIRTDPALEVIAPGKVGAGAMARVVLISAGRTLYAIDLDEGRLHWKVDCGAEVQSSPVRKDLLVYVKTAEGLVAIGINEKADRPSWTLPGGERFILKGREAVYVLGSNRELMALNESTGQVVARYAAGSFSQVATNLTDGLLYVAGPGNQVTCLTDLP